METDRKGHNSINKPNRFMNIKHTLLIGMAMSFSACTQNVNNSDIIPGTADVASLAGVKTIKIENFENEMYCKYSDLYSDVRYVPLEYTQNSMVGNVHEMLITKNNDIVILDYYAKAIFLLILKVSTRTELEMQVMPRMNI